MAFATALPLPITSIPTLPHASRASLCYPLRPPSPCKSLRPLRSTFNTHLSRAQTPHQFKTTHNSRTISLFSRHLVPSLVPSRLDSNSLQVALYTHPTLPCNSAPQSAAHPPVRWLEGSPVRLFIWGDLAPLTSPYGSSCVD